MVDFSVVQAAARRAGWTVAAYGPQATLARGSGVRFDGAAIDLIVRTRALGWVLGAIGVDPEAAWRRGAVGWSSGGAARKPLRRVVARDVEEFVGKRRTPFRLVHLRLG
jgi:hypothetical protein